MATFLSSPLGSGTRATSGERRLATRFSELLEDDYLCWYDVPVGPKYQHPDFILLHPGRGLLILEVKDWGIDSIINANHDSFTVDFDAGRKIQSNPLEQARQYAHVVVRLLESDHQLINPPGDEYAGRLNFPWGYGVVLTNITRRQFDSSGLSSLLPPRLVLCKDEMTESVDPEAFQKRLWDMFNVRFTSQLTLPQVERIRACLFPDIRISRQGLFAEESEPDASEGLLETDLQVMDLRQEAIARGLGEGHRVIHGVAGSGKTLILAYRCEFLARTLNKPILVLVYNKALATWLAHQVAARGLADRVSVRTFHGWCHDQLTLYHVPKPVSEGQSFYKDLVATVIRAVDSGQIPRAQYGALLIDEGHDFEPDWLRLVVQMLDPESNSLLLLYDDAQSIYVANRPKSFTFRSVGISAPGRTKILKRNYRNTDEILACASTFAREILSPKEADEDSVPLVSPEPGGRKGPRPRFCETQSAREEAAIIRRELLRLHAQGTPWREMGVVYTARFVGDEVAPAFEEAGVPFEWLKDSQSKYFDAGRDCVRVMTAQSSKGLQYKVGVVAGAGYWPWKSESDEARLMYVAMTRAVEELLITSSKNSVFSERLRALCVPMAA
jgi:Nuclease-related domain/AAA domain/UvrD-like helicase C-terminal domain